MTSLDRCLVPHGRDPVQSDVKIEGSVYLFILRLARVGFGPGSLHAGTVLCSVSSIRARKTARRIPGWTFFKSQSFKPGIMKYVPKWPDTVRLLQ